MSKVCVDCGMKSRRGARRCQRCSELVSAGWPVKHDGPIRAGDTFHGVNGFVWGKCGQFIVMYCIPKDYQERDAEAVRRCVTERLLRSGGIDVPNPMGQIIRESVKTAELFPGGVAS